MNFDRKTIVKSAAALIAVGATAFTSAYAQPEGLQGSVVAAERYRAVQEGAAAIKLHAATPAAPQAQRVADRTPEAASAAAELRVRGGNVAAERRAPDGNMAAELRVRGGNVAAELRAPDGNMAAELRVRGG